MIFHSPNSPSASYIQISCMERESNAEIAPNYWGVGKARKTTSDIFSSLTKETWLSYRFEFLGDISLPIAQGSWSSLNLLLSHPLFRNAYLLSYLIHLPQYLSWFIRPSLTCSAHQPWPSQLQEPYPSLISMYNLQQLAGRLNPRCRHCSKVAFDFHDIQLSNFPDHGP